jgi:hypothetical protein
MQCVWGCFVDGRAQDSYGRSGMTVSLRHDGTTPLTASLQQNVRPEDGYKGVLVCLLLLCSYMFPHVSESIAETCTWSFVTNFFSPFLMKWFELHTKKDKNNCDQCNSSLDLDLLVSLLTIALNLSLTMISTYLQVC